MTPNETLAAAMAGNKAPLVKAELKHINSNIKPETMETMPHRTAEAYRLSGGLVFWSTQGSAQCRRCSGEGDVVHEHDIVTCGACQGSGRHQASGPDFITDVDGNLLDMPALMYVADAGYPRRTPAVETLKRWLGEVTA